MNARGLPAGYLRSSLHCQFPPISFSAFPAAAEPPPGTRKNEVRAGARVGSLERKYPAGKPRALHRVPLGAGPVVVSCVTSLLLDSIVWIVPTSTASRMNHAAA